MAENVKSKIERAQNTIKHFEDKARREAQHAKTDYKNKVKHLANEKMARDRVSSCKESLKKLQKENKQ